MKEKQECIPVGCLPSAAVAMSITCMHWAGVSAQGGVCPGGVYSGMQTSPLWAEWLTDRSKNITFPQLHLREVKTFDKQNDHAIKSKAEIILQIWPILSNTKIQLKFGQTTSARLVQNMRYSTTALWFPEGTSTPNEGVVSTCYLAKFFWKLHENCTVVSSVPLGHTSHHCKVAWLWTESYETLLHKYAINKIPGSGWHSI